MAEQAGVQESRATPGKRVLSFARTLLSKQEAAVIIPFVLFTLFFYSRNSAMFAPGTITSVLRTMAYPGLIAMGMVTLMIAGEIDLSTGAVMSLCAVFAAWMMNVQGWPIWVSALVSLVAALLVGLINSVLTVKIGVNSIIVTIATAFAVRGVSYLFTNGVPIYPLPEALDTLGDIRPLGLSVAFFLMLAVMIVIQVILNRTRWGQMIFATGGNRDAAQVCGINTDRVKIVTFLLTSLLAGVSGMLLMAGLPLPSGDPIIGKNIELDIIAGVVLGGVSFYGGRGSAIGTFFGVLMIQVIRTGLVVGRFDPYYQMAVLGLLMAGAASVDVIRHRRSEG
jgi:ribose transport system permease protein